MKQNVKKAGAVVTSAVLSSMLILSCGHREESLSVQMEATETASEIPETSEVSEVSDSEASDSEAAPGKTAVSEVSDVSEVTEVPDVSEVAPAYSLSEGSDMTEHSTTSTRPETASKASKESEKETKQTDAAQEQTEAARTSGFRESSTAETPEIETPAVTEQTEIRETEGATITEPETEPVHVPEDTAPFAEIQTYVLNTGRMDFSVRPVISESDAASAFLQGVNAAREAQSRGMLTISPELTEQAGKSTAFMAAVHSAGHDYTAGNEFLTFIYPFIESLSGNGTGDFTESSGMRNHDTGMNGFYDLGVYAANVHSPLLLNASHAGISVRFDPGYPVYAGTRYGTKIYVYGAFVISCIGVSTE